LRASDFDLRRLIRDGSMALGDFINQCASVDESALQDLAHTPDQIIVLRRLLDVCVRNQQHRRHGGFVSEGFIGEEAFADMLYEVAYPYHESEIAQLQADYRRRKFWYRLLTLGMGKNPPDEPSLPEHPLLTALDELSCGNLLERIENPDSPRRTVVVFPSSTLIRRLLAQSKRTVTG
jgi:hypothetical protein